ncbi:MAG TPA: HupE/UreJ family protein [Polyangia bacterium]|jgi:hypothetical protein|nr:HupE/UreJ family protein [Polyangia bacterium]
MRWVLIGCAVASLLVVVPRAACAHDVRGTRIFLAVDAHVVDVELQLPTAELARALQHPIGHIEGILDGNEADELMTYVQAHLAAHARSGAPMTVTVRSADLERIDDGDALVVHATLTAPAGESARYFVLDYDGIVHRVINHNIFVFVRRDLQHGIVDGTQPIGFMHYQRRSIVVDRTGGSNWQALRAMFLLGTHHIADGIDHLLFLLMLLLAAPLVARGRRWRGRATLRQSLLATVRIVTAFTLGHSLTLMLATFRGEPFPVRVAEVLIAVSILVSAVHVLRPLFAGKEALVAGTFGLVHGLAFASALTGYGCEGSSLLLSVLGFNLGVEAMQLFVVALILPSLLLIGRSPNQATLRIAGGTFGVLAATAWIAQRAFGVTTPITALVEAIPNHALWFVGALAIWAIVATYYPRQQTAAAASH